MEVELNGGLCGLLYTECSSSYRLEPRLLVVSHYYYFYYYYYYYVAQNICIVVVQAPPGGAVSPVSHHVCRFIITKRHHHQHHLMMNGRSLVYSSGIIACAPKVIQSASQPGWMDECSAGNFIKHTKQDSTCCAVSCITI